MRDNPLMYERVWVIEDKYGIDLERGVFAKQPEGEDSVLFVRFDEEVLKKLGYEKKYVSKTGWDPW